MNLYKIDVETANDGQFCYIVAAHNPKDDEIRHYVLKKLRRTIIDDMEIESIAVRKVSTVASLTGDRYRVAL